MLNTLLQISLITTAALAACPHGPDHETPVGREQPLAQAGSLRLRAAIAFPVVAIMGNGDIVASTEPAKGAVALWDVESGSRTSCISGVNKDGAITDLVLSPDGSKLAVGMRSSDCTVESHNAYQVSVWGVPSGTRLFETATHCAQAGFPDRVAIAFSADSKSVAFAYKSGRIEIVDADNGRVRKAIEVNVRSIPTTILFSADGNRLGAAGSSWLRVLEIATGDVLIAADAKYGGVVASQQRPTSPKTSEP